MSLTFQSLEGLVEDLVGAGVRVIAPARSADGGIDYAPIQSLHDAVLEGPRPRRSLRAVSQPPTEPVLSWRRSGGDLKVEPASTSFPPQVVLGARPCDAAGVEVLDRVMGWDTRDDLWFGRREATTLIGLGCREAGPSCFCEAVGLGSGSTRGTDLLLRCTQAGYRVEVVTPKGADFVAAHASRFRGGEGPEPVPLAETGHPAFPLDAVQRWLESHFEDALWPDLALRCLGCGACTSVCPTCHCFDLVDEPESTRQGTRRRNWDTCQAGLFTLHASGHNPRPDQSARCRQRVMHKFAIYPRRFGATLCTGCGRCVSACPAGISLPEILEGISRLAKEAQAAGGAA